MTIKLLVAIQGAGGVEIPAGTEVTLSDAVEAAHVSANKAVYTRTPARFDAPPSSGIGVKYDPFTGNIEIPGVFTSSELMYARSVKKLTRAVQIAYFGDSTANGGYANTDLSLINVPFPATGSTLIVPMQLWKNSLALMNPSVAMTGNAGVSGETTTQMLARDLAAPSATRKSASDVAALNPDLVIFRGGSVNNLYHVTAANIDAVVNKTANEHAALIARLGSSGAIVLDEGIFGYTKTASFPADSETHTQLAITRLNNIYADAAKNSGGRVHFLSPTGILSSGSGAYLPNVSHDGVHLDLYGSVLLEKRESEFINALFGARNYVYYGKNIAVNTDMSATEAVSYGVTATGYSAHTNAAATVANAKVEVIDGKVWQTAEFMAVAPTAQGYIQLPWTPGNYGFLPIDTVGIEFDFFVESLDGSQLPELAGSGIMARVDTYKSGAGRIIIDEIIGVIPNVTCTLTGLNRISGHVTVPKWLIGEASANLTASSMSALYYTAAASGTAWKMGVSEFRVVKNPVY